MTGGAGYLGATLVPLLLKHGHLVTVLDNFMYGQTPFNHICSNPMFDVVNGDCRDNETLRPLVKWADVVIPLAALVGAPLCDKNQIGAKSTNLDAVKSLTMWMSREQRLLIPISNSGYGVGEPGKECTEETPMRPVSLYGLTKVEAEKAALGHGNTISFRLATVFGASPRMRVDLLLNEFVWKAVTDRSIVLFEPDFMRNFCHVRDVASAFVHGLVNFDHMKNQVYNVGDTAANISKRQLCERISKHVPEFEVFEAKIGTDPDKRDYIVSNAKIESAGWKPKYTIDFGIQELIKLYRTFPKFRLGNV